MQRISLTKDDFATLIAGGVVEKDGAQIILQDIGYFVMRDMIDDKIEKL